MTRIILDQPTGGRFANFSERAEICDHEGRTLGIFIPVVDRTLVARMQALFTEMTVSRVRRQFNVAAFARMRGHHARILANAATNTWRRSCETGIEEELDRFEQEPGGRSLAEILADLERAS